MSSRRPSEVQRQLSIRSPPRWPTSILLPHHICNVVKILWSIVKKCWNHVSVRTRTLTTHNCDNTSVLYSMDIANRKLESLKPLVITTRDAALVKQTNCDATKRLTIDCRRTRCPSLDEYSSTNPACMDEELTKCGVHVRSDARRATTPEECLKSTTCSVFFPLCLFSLNFA